MEGDGAVLAGTSDCETGWETLEKVKWCGARLSKKYRWIEMVLKLTCDSDATTLGYMLVVSQVSLIHA